MKLQENKYKAKLHTMALVWRLCLGTTKDVCLRGSGCGVHVLDTSHEL